MYVCLCHAVTERKIREAARNGVSDFEELQAATGVATCCGACREYAEETWQEALAADALSRLDSAAQIWSPVI